MAKLVCHAKKYKKGSVSSIERHNERKNINYSNEEIDPTRTHLNYSLIQRDNESYYRSVMDLVNARDNPSGKALRKDAVVLCEFIISSSNEFFDTIPAEEQRRFFEEANRYLQEFFGKKHCIYAAVHYDEHTPHMHFGFVPLTAENKLCAKEIINRSTLLRLQAEMPKFLREKGFQIERGEVGSTAVHKGVKQYKTDMEKEKAALADLIQTEKQELSKLASIKEELHKRPSIKARLATAKLESELYELRIFKERSEKFLSEHGLLDYFRRAIIHSNNRDL